MRRRLVAAAVAAVATIVLAFCIPLGRFVRDVARERAVAAAERDAERVAGALAVNADAVELAAVIDTTGAGSVRLGVVLPDGRRIGAAIPADEQLELARTSSTAFEVQIRGAAAWISPIPVSGGVAVVHVAIPAAELRRGVTSAWLMIAAVAGSLLVVGVAIADRFSRSVTRITEALAGAVAQVANGDLAVRVTPSGPSELAHLAAGFNDLAARVGDLVAAEREGVADLAHRLRTPLTAMRLDAEAAGDDDRDRLLADVEALERAVDTVIAEARRPAQQATTPVSDLAEITGERVGFWAALAEDQHRRQTLEIAPGRYPVAVPPPDLVAAVDALLDNVFTHTPTGTGFAVRVAPEGPGAVRLVVRDQGPGFGAAGAPSRGVSGSGGTGLGLDIARRAVEAGGGTLDAADDHGAVIVIRLPLVASSGGRPRRGSAAGSAPAALQASGQLDRS